jgi:hypothetical protein
MKNIILIPTDKPSRLGYLTKKGKEVFKDLRLFDRLMPNILDSENQNIYITSDEEIKEEDWCLDIFLQAIFQANSFMGIKTKNTARKIILTTDADLIADGVQAIDDEFLNWFVENPTCEFVDVIKEMYVPQSNGKISDGKISHEISLNPSDNTLPFYKIIIPKEELEEEFFGYDPNAPGDPDKIDDLKEQKTLEEVAENYSRITLNKNGLMSDKQVNGFIAGAKWQAERSYSEEEVLSLLLNCPGPYLTDKEIKEWFEQFKKK